MSYTILYSGEAVIATLDPLTVTATLPNLSMVAGGITVIVGQVAAAASLPNLNAILGTATAVLSEMGIQASPQDLNLVSGPITSVVGEMNVLATLPALVGSPGLLTAIIGQIDVLSTLNDITIRYFRTSFLDSIVIDASLPSLTVGLSLSIPDPVIIRIHPDELARGQSLARLTVANEWGGVIFCSPQGNIYTTQRAVIISEGYEILEEVQRAGSTYVYAVGPYPEFFMNNKAVYPSIFIRLPRGVPVSSELIREWHYRTTANTFGI